MLIIDSYTKRGLKILKQRNIFYQLLDVALYN